MGTLVAIPRAWFSWDFRVLDGDRPVANIDVSWWREKGTLTVDGSEYTVRREGLVSGAFLLESADGVLARAVKPSAFRRTLTIEAGKTYTLRPASLFRRAFLLIQGERTVGRLSPVNFLLRRMRVDLPSDLPLPVRVFVIWLTIILWKRESDAAASGGG